MGIDIQIIPFSFTYGWESLARSRWTDFLLASCEIASALSSQNWRNDCFIFEFFHVRDIRGLLSQEDGYLPLSFIAVMVVCIIDTRFH
jgi:hypothetical protein